MFRNNVILLAALSIVAGLSLSACGANNAANNSNNSSSNPNSQGGAKILAMGSALSIADVNSISVTVSGQGISTPIVSNLTKDGAQWKGQVDHIPAGTNRDFSASAKDILGNEVYVGDMPNITIEKDKTAQVVIVLQEKNHKPPYGNAAPVIDGLLISLVELQTNQTVQLSVKAHDPDSDPLTYLWTANSGSFSDPAAPNTVWTAPVTGGDYVITIKVDDGKKHPVTISVTIRVTGGVDEGSALIIASLNSWPTIEAMYSDLNYVPGLNKTTKLTAEITDTDGDAVTYAWTSSCVGAFAPSATDASPVFTLATLPSDNSCTFTVVADDGRGGSGKGDLALSVGEPIFNANPCSNQPDGTFCDDSNSCTTGDVCTAGVCGGAAKTCTASDACHSAGVCDIATGICSTGSAVADGVVCDDSDICTTGEFCTAGVCGGGSVVSGCSTTDTCHASDGSALPDGTACDDSDKCTTGEACTTGVCGHGNPVVCTASNLCKVEGACVSSTGVCSLETDVVCPTGQQCDVADGQCKGGGPVTTPYHATVAKKLDVPSASGLSTDKDGNPYTAGTLFNTANFGAGDVISAGSADLFVAKHDPATGNAVWAKAFGDSQDQFGVGSAVASTGQVGVIGNFTGSMTMGSTVSNPSASAVDFVGAVDGSNGAGLWIKKVDLGGGAQFGVAGSPTDDSLVVCGFALNAATDLVPSAVSGEGKDIVVAKLKATDGSVVWARQIGGAGDQVCSAVAFDDAGNVVMTGQYNGTLDFGGGAFPTVTAARQWIFVAKLNGATGDTMASKSFGDGSGRQAPKSISVDNDGAVVIAGNLSQKVTFGTTVLTSVGGTDAFVAKLDPTALAPIWAVRFGSAGSDEAHSVAVNSSGAVVVVGLFNGAMDVGGVSLTAAGATAADAFVVEIKGSDGSTVSAKAYGDENGQQADAIVINRLATNAEKDVAYVVGGFTSVIDFGAPAGSLSTTGPSDARSFLIKEMNN